MARMHWPDLTEIHSRVRFRAKGVIAEGGRYIESGWADSDLQIVKVHWEADASGGPPVSH